MRANVPAGSSCLECGKPAELGITAPSRGIMLFCRGCALKLAKRHKMHALLKQLEEDKPS